MFDEMRDRLMQHIQNQAWAVLAVTDLIGPRAVPVRYFVEGTNVHCLVPRWVDLGYYLEQNPRVALVIPEEPPSELCWTEVEGHAVVIEGPNGNGLPSRHPAQAAVLYQLVRIMPVRIARIDQTCGWGSRETLDLERSQ